MGEIDSEVIFRRLTTKANSNTKANSKSCLLSDCSNDPRSFDVGMRGTSVDTAALLQNIPIYRLVALYDYYLENSILHGNENEKGELEPQRVLQMGVHW